MKPWDTVRSVIVILGLIGLLLMGFATDQRLKHHTACCSADICEKEGHHR